MSEINLKPCPHCGSFKTCIRTMSYFRFKVICKTCFAAGGARFTKEEAAKVWNRRVMA
ncbi:MAG: Lar family restriction alleviation protein [Synergistaceae bacterium]|nr:Lar family restriction alleviation protein [Synergistaceae bacterium]MBR1603026.1 Lar family restriction alleviation protein [Synergistaceae bacterium]